MLSGVWLGPCQARSIRSPPIVSVRAEKHVASSTTAKPTWANTTVIDGGIPEFVTELKARSGGDIGVHGSIALTQSLIEGGLVDELRLVIAPALQLHGRKLFEGGSSRRLTLTRNVVSPSGYLLLDFTVADLGVTNSSAAVLT
jgi:dihydrofolate reductase